jgi:hypothetical protein
MTEPVLQPGSSVASPDQPGEFGKVRAHKGPETVINPERRAAPVLPAATVAQAAPAVGSSVKSSIVRMLFPVEDETAAQTFDAQSGIQLGHFAIIERIRTGGMGAVFRALDTRLNRVVALKVLPPALSRDPLIVQRFKNEGQAAAQLDHENVARVYYIGEEHGLHYIAFEFINGFHDTANAVATVIYTHSLPAHLAVVWSGVFNFLGVMVSSGAVAFSVLSLLPVELILQVGGSAGFAMIFALLIAAIVWNLGTWWLGLPASSSHTLIGSIIGVGLANQFMAPAGSGTSGVDWSQAMGVFRALLISPVVGFVFAALMLLAMKLLIRNRTLYTAPTSDRPPPAWIRGLLILTCTGVSFAHGSNDGQKGMGLIMLILIGSVPTAFALNHAMPRSATPAQGRRLIRLRS